MLFNSLQFLLFFVIITTAYYFLPHRYRWLLLLIGSCYFYMAFVPIYILILMGTILIDYAAGIWIEQSTGKARKKWLLASIVANVGVLCIFKYYNFFNDNLTALFSQTGHTNPVPYLSILLPIGLSFHTFQAMSYTIEVYKGNQKAERHLGIYALYVMFYPQLVAGPIERPQNVMYQFREYHRFSLDNLSVGLKLILWGLFKKVVIADRLAVIVNFVYSNPTQFEGFPLIIATIAFAIQIYCDFSGYSDIALGTAQALGFSLMRNFNRPYLATSVSDFWRRWHISLSTWFRDYLYIPLGGSRASVPRWFINLFITFLISGLWHGANWTYVIWGMLNGLYLIMEIVLAPVLKQVPNNLQKPLGWLSTCSLICLSWIFFRASSVTDAFYIVTHLFHLENTLVIVMKTNMGTTKYEWLIAMASLSLLFFIEYLQEKGLTWYWEKEENLLLRTTGYYVLAILIILFGVYDVQEQFIYFQF